MVSSSAVAKTFAKCLSCDSTFVAELSADGSIRPLGIARECTCGEGDFVSLG